ncbi:hypothetical protein OH76DRAFT_825315 [Lentinus brumalis]|uniref:Secreted protein n=1 Tax=Lentinus brumalis TaxID=2498619 RepID=A0A371D2A9_9APHY|nr:hypothetical protein OH76DRAFT_825315 [Polyporus brumalis]
MEQGQTIIVYALLLCVCCGPAACAPHAMTLALRVCTHLSLFICILAVHNTSSRVSDGPLCEGCKDECSSWMFPCGFYVGSAVDAMVSAK